MITNAVSKASSTKRTRRMTALRMTGVAGVRRAANRAQLVDENDELDGVDGWAVMKADGTPVDLDGEQTVQKAERLEREVRGLRACNVVLRSHLESRTGAWERIKRAADELRTRAPELTREQAIDRACRERPDLVALYRNATEKTSPFTHVVLRAADDVNVEAWAQVNELAAPLVTAAVPWTEAIRLVLEQRPDLAAAVGVTVDKSEQRPAPPPASIAWARITRAADDLRATEPALTRERAIDRITRDRPELVAALRVERGY